MSDKNLRLTRRRVLGALGAAGAGAALGGAGTMAFFSDEEDFTENSLVAGSLDLRVDWEEHYWRGDDSEVDVDLVRGEDVGEDRIGLPDPENPLVSIPAESLDQFMADTAIEAYPDSNDNSQQDDLENYDACEHFAQLDRDLDPVNGGYTVNPGEDPSLVAKRTNNDDTNSGGDQEVEVEPLVNLEDVKPGDFGELTLSFHLCDNPGYVWLTGGLVEAAENGHTEPEEADPDEEGGPNTRNDTGNDVELVNEIQTMLWYDDDGDNVFNPEGEEGAVDVVLVLDRSGSMEGDGLTNSQNAANTLIDQLGPNAQVGVVSFSDSATTNQGLTSDKQDAKDAVNALTAGGSTNLSAGVNTGQSVLSGGRSGARKVMVALTDGQPDSDSDSRSAATNAKNAGTEIFTVGFGSGIGNDEETLLEDIASDPPTSHAFIGQQQDLINIFSQIGQILTGEEAFFRGTLAELLDVLESTGGNNVAGIPLDGDRSSSYDEVIDDSEEEGRIPNDGDLEERDCFVNSTNNFIGLAWWLPADHGNEVQTDSVSFDLGFYTEQCRHNDGLGIAGEDTANQ